MRVGPIFDHSWRSVEPLNPTKPWKIWGVPAKTCDDMLNIDWQCLRTRWDEVPSPAGLQSLSFRSCRWTSGHLLVVRKHGAGTAWYPLGDANGGESDWELDVDEKLWGLFCGHASDAKDQMNRGLGFGTCTCPAATLGSHTPTGDRERLIRTFAWTHAFRAIPRVRDCTLAIYQEYPRIILAIYQAYIKAIYPPVWDRPHHRRWLLRDHFLLDCGV